MSLLRNLARGALGGAARRGTAGRGLLGAGLGVIAARVATRSVPGALLVGGGIVAKYLWDRQKDGSQDGQTDTPAAMEPEDIEMAMARAEGEPDIAEGAVPPERGIPDVD